MKNKKGKKLVVLGAMAALLTLIGVSGSQTYAKYVESTTVPTQSATVAKWGYTVTTTATSLFGSQYQMDKTATPPETIATVYSSGSEITAKAIAPAHNIVAPGTSGFMTVNVFGVAEVDALLQFGFDAGQIHEIHLGDYYPLKWTAEVDLTSNGSFDYSTADDDTGTDPFEKTLNSVLTELELDNNFYYEAAEQVNLTVKLSWEWAFSVNAETDALDTQLAVLSNGVDSFQYTVAGIVANYPTNRATDCQFEFNVTLTQQQGA